MTESQGAIGAIQEMLRKAMEGKGYTPDSKLGRRFWDAGRKEGRQEGRQEGLGAVVHQFERKVGRALTDKVREVLHLDGPALATWLVTPAA